MGNILINTSVPGLAAANSIMAKIKKVGIQDVELMWDKDIKMWGVCQLFKPTNTILIMNTNQSRETQPNLMWWCKTPEGTYREPNDQDLNDIVATVQRAQVVFDKGSDWMIDAIERKEQEQYDENRRKQSERIRSFAKPLKKAFKEEGL